MWLCWQQEETRFQHFSKMANLTQLHHRKNPVGTWNFDMKQELYWSTSFAVFCVKIFLAYVASVSVRFYRSKERGTRVEDRAKNGASKRAGRGWGRKEGNVPPPPPTFIFWLSSFISRAAKTENPVSRSFFAPKPNRNACYAGYISQDPVVH